ncbi:MAG TPA: hypothetical protein VJB66_05400 [Candidatus Nanoarchaeia archaeon]|nr:hypothetical protein [Candidatus Nanoarchaeia archaeon]
MKEVVLRLIDPKIVAVLTVLAQSKDVYLRECAKLSNTPPSTTLRILDQLASMNLVHIEQIKHLKLYSFADTDDARDLKSLLRKVKS